MNNKEITLLKSLIMKKNISPLENFIICFLMKKLELWEKEQEDLDNIDKYIYSQEKILKL